MVPWAAIQQKIQQPSVRKFISLGVILTCVISLGLFVWQSKASAPRNSNTPAQPQILGTREQTTTSLRPLENQGNTVATTTGDVQVYNNTPNFEDAFAQARQQLGSGKEFVWNGKNTARI